MKYEQDMFYDNISSPMDMLYVEPYVMSALKPLIGTKVVIETTRGGLHGVLVDVKPDHIVLGEPYDDTVFLIRMAEIVHIMPTKSN